VSMTGCNGPDPGLGEQMLTTRIANTEYWRGRLRGRLSTTGFQTTRVMVFSAEAAGCTVW
jgi:hypothetical protein